MGSSSTVRELLVLLFSTDIQNGVPSIVKKQSEVYSPSIPTDKIAGRKASFVFFLKCPHFDEFGKTLAIFKETVSSGKKYSLKNGCYLFDENPDRRHSILERNINSASKKGQEAAYL
ncbi:hypothetical protein V6N12_072168 [Hibiscus sabdariffa]|uniref:Uncharacterized protein n=1 Tax=Hibiscus sabdariffa TaxID=183260 RepID=A0ABR2FLX7_9ROSI